MILDYCSFLSNNIFESQSSWIMAQEPIEITSPLSVKQFCLVLTHFGEPFPKNSLGPSRKDWQKPGLTLDNTHCRHKYVLDKTFLRMSRSKLIKQKKAKCHQWDEEKESGLEDGSVRTVLTLKAWRSEFYPRTHNQSINQSLCILVHTYNAHTREAKWWCSLGPACPPI